MKVICIGDLHFGAKKDSEVFLEQILSFLDWVCGIADQRDIEHCVQFGDWFESRNSVSVNTLNYAITGAQKLSKRFSKENLYILKGNHDLFHLHRLDVSSLNILKPYATVIDEPTSVFNNTVITPWIVDEEMWNQVTDLGEKNDYLFGHFELNGFLVNDNYVMESGYSHKELRDYDRVLTGHYHSKQEKDNVVYLGTPYPITMSEANEEHGVYIFDTDTGDLEFIEYEGLRAVSISYKDIDQLDDCDPSITSVRIEFPDDLEDESVIEETMTKLHERNFNEVKMKYRGNKAKELLEADIDDVEEVEDIDALVIQYLDKKNSSLDGVNRELMKEIYLEAKKEQA